MSKEADATDSGIGSDDNGTDELGAENSRPGGLGDTGHQSDGPPASGFSRRGALAALTGLGALGLGSGTASAVEAHDHLGESWEGNSSTDYGLQIKATSGTQTGFEGFSSDSNGRGVRGQVTSSTGSSIGVLGKVDSTSDFATGVSGIATAGKDTAGVTGTTYGVKGITYSEEGRGVLGRAHANSGRNIGVLGQTDSSGNKAVAVNGFASNSDGNTFAVRGRNDSTDGTAVLGTATNSSGSTTGVEGRVSSNDGIAVIADNTSGKQALEAKGDADVTGDLSVGGELSVGELGAEAYLDANTQTVSASNSGTATVEFDNEVTDDRGEYDPNNGVFTAASDGAYLVTAQITWDGSTISANVPTYVEIHYDGSAIT